MSINGVRVVANDSEFDPELTNAGTKLVVADFFATWCGPCQRIAPVFVQLSAKYPKAVFLKVDVDQCQETAHREGVSAMPTFIFYRNKVKIDLLRGADATAIEDKIKKWYGDGEEETGDEVTVKGHMDLSTFINKSGCDCLNEADDHPLAHCLTTKGGYLESDCDEQLLISIEFNQPVKVHSLKIYGPADKGPKMVKVFQNQPRSLDFDSASDMEATQTLEVDDRCAILLGLKVNLPDNITCSVHGLSVIEHCHHHSHPETVLISGKLFIEDNQSGGEITQVDYLGFIGSPVSSTNMNEFKRVAGKKGEGH